MPAKNQFLPRPKCKRCGAICKKRGLIFCSKRCAGIFNNPKQPPLTVEEKRKRQQKYYTNWYEKNPAHAKVIEAKQFSTFYCTPHGRAVHMLNNARNRAKREKIECSLTVEWIEDRLKKGTCDITGIPLVLNTGFGKGHRVNSFSPSIDRIDQEGDYSPKNCRVTCWIYNRARGAFPKADFDRMVAALHNRNCKNLHAGPGVCQSETEIDP